MLILGIVFPNKPCYSMSIEKIRALFLFLHNNIAITQCQEKGNHTPLYGGYYYA